MEHKTKILNEIITEVNEIEVILKNRWKLNEKEISLCFNVFPENYLLKQYRMIFSLHQIDRTSNDLYRRMDNFSEVARKELPKLFINYYIDGSIYKQKCFVKDASQLLLMYEYYLTESVSCDNFEMSYISFKIFSLTYDLAYVVLNNSGDKETWKASIQWVKNKFPEFVPE